VVEFRRLPALGSRKKEDTATTIMEIQKAFAGPGFDERPPEFGEATGYEANRRVYRHLLLSLTTAKVHKWLHDLAASPARPGRRVPLDRCQRHRLDLT
jgi:hypothetical protein